MTAPVAPSLPRLRHSDPVLQAWANQMVDALDAITMQLQNPAGDTDYTLIGEVPLRTLNVTAGSLNETRQVLATLIGDLKAKGQVA